MIENESMLKLLQLISEFGNVSEKYTCKIQYFFHYINNKMIENEMKHKIPFIITSKILNKKE